MKAYLSPTVLLWYARDEGGRAVDHAQRQRSYTHLQRAEYFLDCDTVSTDHDRADCIGNLRRCLTHRLKLLDEVYGLRTVLSESVRRPYLEILADVGLVRASLLKTLLSVRNQLEYNDATPPDASRCREFADAVWYLLRATDPPLYTERTDVVLTPPDADPCDSLHWYSLRIQYVPDFEVHLFGWFPAAIVRQEPSNSSIELEAKDIFTKQEKWSDDDLHSDRRPDDVWVSGRALPTAEQKRTITRLALTTV